MSYQYRHISIHDLITQHDPSGSSPYVQLKDTRRHEIYTIQVVAFDMDEYTMTFRKDGQDSNKTFSLSGYGIFWTCCERV